MSIGRIVPAVAAAVAVMSLAVPAAAQFDTLHDHLKCYKIKGPSIAVNLILDNQFGRERVFKLVPDSLCLPTQKTCCDPTSTQPGCVAVPCGPDPVPATPVQHFKCYKVQAKQCVDPNCTTVVGKFVKPTVTLVDQFHTEVVEAGPVKTLCTPVLKEVVNTTTTTRTTTTTLRPCLAPDATGLCAGDCPLQTKCLATSATSCDCVPVAQMCMGDAASGCAGLCMNVNQVCALVSPTAPCTCVTTCGAASAPACDGACPAGTVCTPNATGGGCSCG
jgi:hypothetical protein